MELSTPRTSHTFPCIFFPRAIFRVVHGWFNIQTNVWKVQNTTGRFLAQLHPFNFFLKILFLFQKFPIHEFFRGDVLWKLFVIGFPYKHCWSLLFQTCLPTRQNGVENRDKAYCLCIFVGNNNKSKLKLNWIESFINKQLTECSNFNNTSLNIHNNNFSPKFFEFVRRKERRQVILFPLRRPIDTICKIICLPKYIFFWLYPEEVKVLLYC